MCSNPQGFRWIYLPTRLAIYTRDRWQCVACDRALEWRKGKGDWTDMRSERASLDHLIPASRGGSNAPTNLVTACVGCNTERGDLLVEEWRPDLSSRYYEAVQRPIDRRAARELAWRLDPVFARRDMGR